jgi:lysophospholipase
LSNQSSGYIRRLLNGSIALHTRFSWSEDKHLGIHLANHITPQPLYKQALGAITYEASNVVPNPFYASDQSPTVSSEKTLKLDDGGTSNENIPIWPFIQPQRPADVIIGMQHLSSSKITCPWLKGRTPAGDISGDNATTHYTDGQSVYNTYLEAQAANLTRMPFIPPVSTFLAENLTMRAQFFGCNNASTALMVWLPLVSYVSKDCCNLNTFESAIPEKVTETVIANGNLIATQNNDEGWPLCLACAIMKKSGGVLPRGCAVCFEKYCYPQG